MAISPLNLLSEVTLAQGADELARRDADLAAILGRRGVPPLWAREPGFPTLVHIILEQQVSLASAMAAFTKLRAIANPLTPDAFLALDDATLKEAGFSRQKTAYARSLARDLQNGALDLGALEELDDADAHARLVALHGIGDWSASIYLLMALRRGDVWPTGDLALVVAMQIVKGLTKRPSREQMHELAEPWRPLRAVAARLLWSEYLARQRDGQLPRAGAAQGGD